jgi:hypothetical protein
MEAIIIFKIKAISLQGYLDCPFNLICYSLPLPPSSYAQLSGVLADSTGRLATLFKGRSVKLATVLSLAQNVHAYLLDNYYNNYIIDYISYNSSLPVL